MSLSVSTDEASTTAAVLPGRPVPFVVRQGEGEKSVLFDNSFAVLLSSDETEGQYSAATLHGAKGDRIPAHLHQRTHEFFYMVEGALTLWTDDQGEHHEKVLLEPGDFGFVPKNYGHAYRLESNAKVFGVGTADFMRFFGAAGTSTDEYGIPTSV